MAEYGTRFVVPPASRRSPSTAPVRSRASLRSGRSLDLTILILDGAIRTSSCP